MIVNLHIDRVVIEGLPVGSQEAPWIKEALSAELVRLVAESGLAKGFCRSRFDPQIRAEPITQPPRDAGNLGTQIGQVVYGVIGR